MRILLDLQACQTVGSRTRGIGRYSMALARAMLEVGTEHEFWLLLHAGYPEVNEELASSFSALVPRQRIVTFQATTSLPWIAPQSKASNQVAALSRDQVIHSINPDAIHICSAFEGAGDNAVVSLSDPALAARSWITLYDLIPLIHADIYLQNDAMRSWYHHRLNCLQRAAGLLAISESSRQEALQYLDIPDTQVHTISTAIGEQFQPAPANAVQRQMLSDRYGIQGEFIMYTGGIDHRKNIEGLIAAYAALPQSLRAQHLLAIVCSISEAERKRLAALVENAGLAACDVIFTGYVREEDLVTLYSSCHLFVFPSLHEGFGLPVLEAMACGAPVICSDCSSLPEVAGLADAMFDPRDRQQITDAMNRGLTDITYRNRLIENGQQRPGLFSWHNVAKKALAAMTQQQPAAVDTPMPVAAVRPHLAYLTPLPPARSGVAVYSNYLLQQLLKTYRITVVTPEGELESDWAAGGCDVLTPEDFLRHSGRFDRVVYQLGNSGHHEWMVELLNRCPGVVILHDCYLGGMLNYHDVHGHGDGKLFNRALYLSHGYAAVHDAHQQGREAAMLKYSCSAPVLDSARRVLVHSRHAASLVRESSNRRALEPDVIALPVPRPQLPERSAARDALAIDADTTLIVSLGFIAPSKCSAQLIEAFLTAPALQASNSQLHLVGDDYGAVYGEQLRQRIQQAGMEHRIKLTGYVSPACYQQYLAAADIAVQLRANSRGESSAAVLEAMSAGVALILNAHGSAAEIPVDCCQQLPETPDSGQVSRALVNLLQTPARRACLAQAGLRYIQRHHAPAAVAQQCVAAIEQAWQQPELQQRDTLIQRLADIRNSAEGDTVDWAAAGQDIVTNTADQWHPRLLVELEPSQMEQGGLTAAQQARLLEAVIEHSARPRLELVYRRDGQLWHAHQFSARLLSLGEAILPDALLIPVPGDRLHRLNELPDTAAALIPEQDA